MWGANRTIQLAYIIMHLKLQTHFSTFKQPTVALMLMLLTKATAEEETNTCMYRHHPMYN